MNGPRITRRDVLRLGTSGLAVALAPRTPARASDGSWSPGAVRHLLPACNHDRLLLKCSFADTLGTSSRALPRLVIDGRAIPGAPTGTTGRFFRFDVSGVEPATEHVLQLQDAGGSPLCDEWPLRTFPAPGARVERARFLIYTCAGGDERQVLPNGTHVFQAMRARQKLLELALSFEPDFAIGVGDQIYWDQLVLLRRTEQLGRAFVEARERLWDLTGRFERDQLVFGSGNELVLERVGDAQIAALYGTAFRSVPTFLTQDDHDYFENDEAHDDLVTLPPDPFMLRLARATQHLYYPELLPDANRPSGLGGSGAADRAAGLAESYGTLRYGKLLELLLYDCRRFVTTAGPAAHFVEPEAERWLIRRTLADDCRHLVHVPSTPIGWTAGKWGEWYPDVLQAGGTLGKAPGEKPYWPPGWFAQHQRLLEAATRRERAALFLSGDLHAVGAGRILRSSDLDLSANPVTTILSGPVSSGPPAFPSAFRGTGAKPPVDLAVEESLHPIEQNGFTIVDVTEDRIQIRQFAVDLGDPAADVVGLEPIHRFVV